MNLSTANNENLNNNVLNMMGNRIPGVNSRNARTLIPYITYLAQDTSCASEIRGNSIEKLKITAN